MSFLVFLLPLLPPRLFVHSFKSGPILSQTASALRAPIGRWPQRPNNQCKPSVASATDNSRRWQSKDRTGLLHWIILIKNYSLLLCVLTATLTVYTVYTVSHNEPPSQNQNYLNFCYFDWIWTVWIVRYLWVLLNNVCLHFANKKCKFKFEILTEMLFLCLIIYN